MRPRRSPSPTTPSTAWPARYGPPISAAARGSPPRSRTRRSRSTRPARWTPTGRSAGSRTPGSAAKAAPRRSTTTRSARPSSCPRRRTEGARTMSVLVLGSSGLVGRSLVGRLAAAGHSVVAGDVRPSPIPPVAGVSYVHTDISRLDQVLTLVEQHEVSGVVLLSYMMGQLMSLKYADVLQACQTNITGVTNVLEAARLLRVPRVVFLSTVGTYGPQAIYGDRPVTEDEILAPTSMYGQMKALDESICDRYAALYDLEVVKIRPSSILGPGSTIWPSRLIDRVALGETGLAPYGADVRDNVIAV